MNPKKDNTPTLDGTGLGSAEKPLETYIMSIMDINTPKYRLRTPLIPIAVEEWSESDFVAHWHDVEAVGYGDDKWSAIDNLKQDIIDLYENLRETDDSKLGQHPRRWKQILAQVIEEVVNEETESR